MVRVRWKDDTGKLWYCKRVLPFGDPESVDRTDFSISADVLDSEWLTYDEAVQFYGYEECGRIQFDDSVL